MELTFQLYSFIADCLRSNPKKRYNIVVNTNGIILVIRGGGQKDKKTWIRPKSLIENFVQNEYISSCMTISLQCAIPGSYDYLVGDGLQAARDDSYGMSHGICGNESTSFIASASVSGYETVNGKADKSRPISKVQLGSPISNPNPYTRFSSTLNGSTPLESATPGSYYAIWESTDGDGTYHHYGLAEVTAVDSAHPNHS